MSSRRQARPPETSAPARTIKDLISYRIHQLANALSRGAALRYRQEFGVSLMEWRTIALLGDFAPMTLTALARQSGLDKGLASRVVRELVSRGLVRRKTSATDGRELALRLSPQGRRLHVGLMEAARERDVAFRSALTSAEWQAMESAITKLLREARQQARPWSEPAPESPAPGARRRRADGGENSAPDRSP